MPPKIVNLHKSESGENVVTSLEKCLKIAEEGGITNCIVVMTGKDGSVSQIFANHNYPYIMIGAIDAFKYEFMKNSIEMEVNED